MGYDLALLVDIKFMVELSIRLQGKDPLVHKLHEHVVISIQKLKLLQSQLVQKKVVHSPVFSMSRHKLLVPTKAVADCND